MVIRCPNCNAKATRWSEKSYGTKPLGFSDELWKLTRHPLYHCLNCGNTYRNKAKMKMA